MILTISPKENTNFTPVVREALEKLNDGDCLKFESGEYHFYKEGSLTKFLAVSNNSACDKHIVFPIINMNNITVDGCGSSFVFHDVTFPFAVVGSENVELKGFSVDTGITPVGTFRVGRSCEEGFYLEIDKNKSPYRIENGALIFKRENGERSGIDEKFDLIDTENWGVQYLFTGDCRSSHDNLPAKFMLTDAQERDDGLFFKYRSNNVYPIRFSEGTTVSSTLDGGRKTDVILLSHSKNVKIDNVKVRRGIGMGVIAQLTENIEINSFKTDENFHGEGVTLTADALHFVNCSGKLDIHDSEISYTKDDVINIHGMYTRVISVANDLITVKIGHQEQYFFNPYLENDILDAVDMQTFEYTGKARVISSSVKDDGKEIEIKAELISGRICEGELLENTKRMPDVHVHSNNFYHYPNMRISGGGEILIENNALECATSALLAKDLAKYWFESGRIRNLVFKNNRMKNCNALGGSAFITIDLDGADKRRTPKIHDRIEISNNIFEGVKNKTIDAAGVKELVVANNVFLDSDAAEIDGVAQAATSL